jgi:hypothetical protein
MYKSDRNQVKYTLTLIRKNIPKIEYKLFIKSIKDEKKTNFITLWNMFIKFREK